MGLFWKENKLILQPKKLCETITTRKGTTNHTYLQVLLHPVGFESEWQWYVASSRTNICYQLIYHVPKVLIYRKLGVLLKERYYSLLGQIFFPLWDQILLSVWKVGNMFLQAGLQLKGKQFQANIITSVISLGDTVIPKFSTHILSFIKLYINNYMFFYLS